MGVVSDSFKARLDEMRARHAETDRRLAESRARVFETLDKIKAIARDFEEC